MVTAHVRSLRDSIEIENRTSIERQADESVTMVTDLKQTDCAAIPDSIQNNDAPSSDWQTDIGETGNERIL